MAGAHLRLQDDRAVAAVGGPKLRHPFRGLPVRDARVVEAAGDQQRGVPGLVDVVVGRVALDVRVELRLARITPLVVLVDGERQLVVEHRRQGVDERHLGDGAAEQLGPGVEHRADEEAACAPAPDGQAFRRRVALRDQVLGACDEVVERVALAQKLAALVPLPPHLAAAANVSYGEREATVEQAEPRGIEHRVVGVLVGAVAV